MKSHPRPHPYPHPDNNAMMFHHISYENQTLNSKCNELTDIIKSLQEEVFELNEIVSNSYDLSCSRMAYVTIDESGNFYQSFYMDPCGNMIPCILPREHMYDLSNTHHMHDLSNTNHMHDLSNESLNRCFRYGYGRYPYFGYGRYPYFGYGRYPYYRNRFGSDDDDDDIYRDFVITPPNSLHQLPIHPNISQTGNMELPIHMSSSDSSDGDDSDERYFEYPYYNPYYIPYYNPYYSPDYNPYYPLLYRDASFGIVPNKKIILPKNPTHIHIYPYGNIVPPSPINYIPVPK
jgi:hypothetical protein